MISKRAQIAIEFTLLIALSIAATIAILSAVSQLTSNKIDEKSYYEIEDYGNSLQQEIIMASEMEEGYYRSINIPVTVNGRSYNLTNNQTSLFNSYFEIDYRGFSFYYVIPLLNGTLKKGRNILIVKANSTLYVLNG